MKFPQQSISRAVCSYPSLALLCLFLLLLLCYYHKNANQAVDILLIKNHLKGSYFYKNPAFSKKLTVFILNYKRPHNLFISLPLLSEMDIVGEIIVSHGLNTSYKNFNYPKVRNIQHYELNARYGPAVRFMKYDEISNDIVLYLDDDILPEEELIYRSYSMLVNQYDRNTIYGLAKRSCNTDGYSFQEPSNIVLTAFLMTKKSIVSDYMQYGFPVFMKWIKHYHGNCEDLSINLFVKNFYRENIEIIAKNRKLLNLDRSKGISSHGNHYEIRSNFCKLYYNQSFVASSKSLEASHLPNVFITNNTQS